MDPMTALARPIETTAAPTPATHLRLATSEDGSSAVAVPDRTAVFEVDSFRRGGGTDAIELTTTTTIASDPAPVAPAGQSFVIPILDAAVREVLDSGFEVDRTLAAMHVPAMPPPEITQVNTPPAREPIAHDDDDDDDDPLVKRTQFAIHVPNPPVAADADDDDPLANRTLFALHVPAPAPEPIAPAVPQAVDDRAGSDPDGTSSILLRENKKPTPPPAPMMVTNARVVVPGHYLLEDEGDAALGVTVGASLLLGRRSGSLLANDPYVDAHHVELTFRPDGVVVDDLDSTNGVFLRVTAPTTLRSGDQFRIGEQLLGYTAFKAGPKNGKAPALGSPDPGYWGRVDVLLGPDMIAASYPIDDVEVGFGQTEGHVQFPDDPFIADLHCRLVKEDKTVAIEDCGSRHGTWVRLRSGDVVPYGAELMVGHTLIRVEAA